MKESKQKASRRSAQKKSASQHTETQVCGVSETALKKEAEDAIVEVNRAYSADN